MPNKDTSPSITITTTFRCNRREHTKIEGIQVKAFNCCENQTLPLITNSPPMALHVDTQARPVAAHKPAPVPLHWQREVKEGLDNDVAMGVLEKVEVGKPTK